MPSAPWCSLVRGHVTPVLQRDFFTNSHKVQQYLTQHTSENEAQGIEYRHRPQVEFRPSSRDGPLLHMKTSSQQSIPTAPKCSSPNLTTMAPIPQTRALPQQLVCRLLATLRPVLATEALNLQAIGPTMV